MRHNLIGAIVQYIITAPVTKAGLLSLHVSQWRTFQIFVIYEHQITIL